MPLLYLFCPVRQKQFVSGVQLDLDILARIEHIGIRMKCPLCEQMHLLVEKGELDETPEE